MVSPRAGGTRRSKRRHEAGSGKLDTTHDVSERLYWNLWAKQSEIRNSNDVMSPGLGDGPEGRKTMKQGCAPCHSPLHTDSFFAQGYKAVRLYNESYWAPAKQVHAELAAKGLLRENPWNDPFQTTLYHVWHQEGRRARHGALMAGPDYAHWHGFFELQQDMCKLQRIHDRRLETHRIGG